MAIKMDDTHHMKFSNDRVKEYAGFKIVSTDPYGMWHVEPPKGPCPAGLAGEWNDLTKLFAKIDNYVANKAIKQNVTGGGAG